MHFHNRFLLLRLVVVRLYTAAFTKCTYNENIQIEFKSIAFEYGIPKKKKYVQPDLKC